MWSKKGARMKIGVVFACSLFLSACGDSRFSDTLETILPDPSDYVYGAFVADDSRAVVAARNALAKGGSAADAAVALYFTLSVTMPSVASLGGGGVCLVHDPRTQRTEMLDFIAPEPKSGVSGGDRPTAVPANVRGMAALHSRFGRLRWSDTVLHAETLARGGFVVSKETASDLARAARPLFVDEGARRVFSMADGSPVTEGELIRQVELGATLGQIRARGAGAFYTGPLANRLVEGMRQAGGTITNQDLRSYRPRWRPALTVQYGEDNLHVAGPPVLSGAVIAQMWQMLLTDKRYEKAPAEERPHLLAEVARRAFSDRETWININGDRQTQSTRLLSSDRARQLMTSYDAGRATPPGVPQSGGGRISENPSGTGFVVVDGLGLAVACTTTLYNPFGTGRLVPGVGIFMAQAPGVGSRNPYSLSPAMVTGRDGKIFRFAAAGVAGQAVPSVIVGVAARTLLENQTAKEAVTGPRLHPLPGSDAVIVEASETPPRVETLARRGHSVLRQPSLGRVNVIYCSTGIPIPSLSKVNCRPVADNRGSGTGLELLIELE